MEQIKTIEDFWKAIDEYRQTRGISWKKLMGANAGLAAAGKMNPTLTKLLHIQELLGINLFYLMTGNNFEPEEVIIKNPETAKKMARIYQLIVDDSWMEDEAIVRRVQELGETII
ncbi:hypothetical protein [Enterococcus sp. CWB-B31]|uniref:hypothetical protein n=1 Tax=Enterococcus sp. CWB-B31 TaxID=2885159 RepID=UPI001E38DD3C|nr:hypothetical protein [Enterococcus sp. CWB-B31]MCB5954034.1 hypothetical protein [Enterococcus sp. CWB-B31]